MHLKNLALQKIAEPGAKTFTSVRVAPLYDAVTTRVFPGLAIDRMALKLTGKDDRLTKADFRALARTISVAGGRAEAVLTEIATRLAAGAAALNLPDMVAHPQISEPARERRVAIVIERSAGLTDWDVPSQLADAIYADWGGKRTAGGKPNAPPPPQKQSFVQ